MRARARCVPGRWHGSRWTRSARRDPTADPARPERNGCDASAEPTFVQGEASCVAWSGCAASSAAELCTIEGGGHTWPGGEDFEGLGHTTHDISATARIAAFFAAHPMP